MKCIYCEKEINDEATFCQYCGGNQISVDGYPGDVYSVYRTPVFIFTFITIISFCFFSWTNDSFEIQQWKYEALFLFALTEICAFYVCWRLYKNKLKEWIQKNERWEKLCKIKYNRNILQSIEKEGGIINVFSKYIDGLGYPIMDEGDTWVKLKITETLSIKLERTGSHCNRVKVTIGGLVNDAIKEQEEVYDDVTFIKDYNIEKIKNKLSKLNIET